MAVRAAHHGISMSIKEGFLRGSGPDAAGQPAGRQPCMVGPAGDRYKSLALPSPTVWTPPSPCARSATENTENRSHVKILVGMLARGHVDRYRKELEVALPWTGLRDV